LVHSSSHLCLLARWESNLVQNEVDLATCLGGGRTREYCLWQVLLSLYTVV